jgi:hypothetical protein
VCIPEAALSAWLRLATHISISLIIGFCRAHNSMAITIAVFLDLGAIGWKSVGGPVLASGVLLLSGHQDIGLRARMGAAFGFFMAGFRYLCSSSHRGQKLTRYSQVDFECNAATTCVTAKFSNSE